MDAFGRAVRVLIAVTLLTPGLATAADTWVEATSPHFTVVSNAGGRKARKLAWEFEQIRAAIEHSWPWARVTLNRPLTVIAVKDESSMKALVPVYWEKGDVHPGSIFLTAADRHYIALRADVEADDRDGVNPYRSAYWSYSALTFAAGFNRGLPLWLTTGLSAVLSNSIVRETEIQFGRPIPGFLRQVVAGPRLRLDQLMTVDIRSPEYTQQPNRSQFDAGCWGLAQYLLFGQDGGGDRVNRLVRLLVDGTPSAVALKEIYGDLDALESAYLLYLKQGLIKYARLKVDTDVPDKKYPERDLPIAEADVVRAGFHVAMGRPVEAGALLDEARKADADSPYRYALEGITFDRDRKRDEAQQAFAKAAELNSSNYYVYYRLANLLWRQNADSATLANVQKLLSKSIALNDESASSFAFLGTVLLQLNQPDNAIGLAERAVSLEPAQLGHRLLLARVLSRQSKIAEAQKAARDAMELARTDQERSSILSLLDSLNRQPPASVQRAAPASPR